MCLCIYCLFFLLTFFSIHPYLISAAIHKHANAESLTFGRRCQTSQWECNSKSVTSNFTLSEGGTCSISQPLIRSLSVEVCARVCVHLGGNVCMNIRTSAWVCVCAREKALTWETLKSVRVYVNVMREKMRSYGFAYIWLIISPFVFLLR